MGNQSSRLKLIATSILMLGLSSPVLATTTVVTITTLKKDGSILVAQNLEYWLTGDHYKKFILKCNSGACSTWRLPTNLIGKQAISMIALVDKPQDPTCSDWYAGEIKPKQGPLNNHLEVRLKYSETACQ